MPIHPVLRWSGLGLLCVATGCASSRNAAATNPSEGAGLRAIFQPRVSQASYEAEVDEVPAKPKDEYLLRLKFAEWMEDAGDTTRAEQQYREIAKAKPKNVAAILGLARMDILAGRYPAAEEGLHRAERLAKHSADVAATYGQLYSAQKDWDRAIEACNRAVQADPDNDDYRYQLALTLVRADQIEASLPHFAATVGDPAGHYNIALILRENGDLAGAEEHLQIALRKRPDMGEARTWLAEVRREQGKGNAPAGGAAPDAPTGSGNVAAAAPTVLAPRNVVMTASAQAPRTPETAHRDAEFASASHPAGLQPRMMAPPSRSTLTPQQREQLNNQQ